ncbi:MAG: hypothetical protein ABJ239_04810 [Erythrobacter sp.]
MATKKQIEANRKNALKSAEPSSTAGKVTSSRNALKHGVLSQEVVADHEDRKAYESLFGQLVDECGPETALECTLVERLSILIWREKRLAKAEAERVKRKYEQAQDFAILNELKGMSLQDQYLIGR